MFTVLFLLPFFTAPFYTSLSRTVDALKVRSYIRIRERPVYFVGTAKGERRESEPKKQSHGEKIDSVLKERETYV